MNNNMGRFGEESPGGAQPHAGAGYPDHLKDSLEDDNDNNRPDSNSSAESRGMDDSPVENSKGSLEAEKEYQEDLRERVKQSFADLGLEPEGVLRDSLEEVSEDPRRKKKQQASKKRPAPRSGGRDGGNQSQQGSREDANDPDNYANVSDGDANEPDDYSAKSNRDEPEDWPS